MVKRLVASFFGAGLILRRFRDSDAGSGTVGAGVALALSLLVAEAGWFWQLALLAATTAAGLWAVAPFARSEGDPGWVVVDEAAGTFLATLGASGWPAIAGFVVFRLADINKRIFPGVAAAERLPGAIGVMADDLIAGIYGLGASLLVAALS